MWVEMGIESGFQGMKWLLEPEIFDFERKKIERNG
jgi:hypothetical protein